MAVQLQHIATISKNKVQQQSKMPTSPQVADAVSTHLVDAQLVVVEAGHHVAQLHRGGKWQTGKRCQSARHRCSCVAVYQDPVLTQSSPVVVFSAH
jgi:hypothetical protein